MNTIRDYRKIQAWEKAHQLVLQVYDRASAFPRQEMFGLTSQMRRAAVLIPSNIAEGCGRGTEAGLARFMSVSQGSGSELHYRLMLARVLGFLGESEYKGLTDSTEEVGRMLSGYIAKLRG